ncbi:MAG: hypothetical protein IJX78_05210 [Bacilli bacterium]|nr:hypothetical protein [Bacilli bacterium]
MNLFTHAYDINNDLEVDLVTNYEKINYVNGINYIQNSTFNGVAAANTGIVTQIKKNNNLYYVTIKSEDDLEYTYGGLESIDVLIYSYVSSNNIIGASPKIKDYYTFTIEIKKDNECFSVSMINNE